MQFDSFFRSLSCRIAVTAVRWVCVCGGKVKVVKCISTWATHADTSSSCAARREKVSLRLQSRKNRGLSRRLFLREVKYLSFTQPGDLFLQQNVPMQCVTCSIWLISSGWRLGWVRVHILFWRTNLDGLSCQESVVMETHHKMWNHIRTWNVLVLSCIFEHSVPVISSSRWLLSLCLHINIRASVVISLVCFWSLDHIWKRLKSGCVLAFAFTFKFVTLLAERLTLMDQRKERCPELIGQVSRYRSE